MSGETTATSVNDIVNSAVISTSMMRAASEFVIAHDKFRYFNGVGMKGNVLQVPKIDGLYTVDDNGATLDTEFDGTEGSPLGLTQVTTSSVSLTCSEYAVSHAISDVIYEDSILGTQFMSMVVMNGAQVLALAVEQAALSLLSGLSNSVGTTNTDLTVAAAMLAADGIRTRGTLADSSVYTFDNKAWSDLKTAAIAASTSLLTYGASAEQIVGVSRDASNGLSAARRVGTFYGIPCYETGLTPTANATVDVLSGCWTPSSPVNDEHATFSYVEKRPFRVEIERDALLRSDIVVLSRRCAVGESCDFSGTKIVSNAAA